ncbi:unnamed protein product [Oikopleura dioica]|nr:unnamed protein product [Oikopleura dioica]
MASYDQMSPRDNILAEVEVIKPHYVDRSKSTESAFIVQKRQQLQELRSASKSAIRQPRAGGQSVDDHRPAGQRNEKVSTLFNRPDSGVIDINSQFDQSFKVDSRPTSRNSFTLQQLKINSTRIPNPKRSREEIRFKNSSSNSPQENNIGLAGLKISTKPRCTPVSVLSSLKKDRINCTCSACEDRKEKKSRLGYDREERLRQLSEQQQYADPIKDADSAFLARIRELKSYDLDTAKQEDSKKRRKNKK